jgi:hypothetical protein
VITPHVQLPEGVLHHTGGLQQHLAEGLILTHRRCGDRPIVDGVGRGTSLRLDRRSLLVEPPRRHFYGRQAALGGAGGIRRGVASARRGIGSARRGIGRADDRCTQQDPGQKHEGARDAKLGEPGLGCDHEILRRN